MSGYYLDTSVAARIILGQSQPAIETRGRSRRLTVNYRTSRQILAWSLRAADPDIDDLDTETDTLAGSRSLFDGPEPVRGTFDTTADEDEGIAAQITEWTADGIDASDIAVFAYSKRQVRGIADTLRARGTAAVVVEGESGESALGEGVRVMTMHRGKGLEFRAVILARLGVDDFPPGYVYRLDGAARAEAELTLRRVLYVAGTRARERLAIMATGRRSNAFAV